MRERHMLITNLEWVTVAGVRTFTHALLLVDGEGLPRRRECRVRGFGTDPAWPTFDIMVDSIEYDLLDGQGNVFKMEDDGSTTPLFTGSIMRLKGGPEMQLVTCDRDRPVDVQEFQGESGDDTYLRIWDALRRKVPEYWTSPNMPTLVWAPPAGGAPETSSTRTT